MMNCNSALRTIRRAPTLARWQPCSPAAPAARHLSATSRTAFRRLPPINHAAWIGASVLTGSILGYSIWELKPEVLPALPTVHAEAPTPAGTYLDPTTSTSFPQTLASPAGPLVLVGTGVRVVSFLSVRVYAIGFYAAQAAVKEISAGKIEGWKDYSPDKLLPPFPKAGDDLSGEALVGTLLDTKHDFAVMIIPLRSTSLPHLRDGFSRALVARLKLPHVTSSLSPEANESAANALTELKGFFPARSLLKGHPMLVQLSGADRSVKFSLLDPTNQSQIDVLGTLRNPVLARQLFLSYFSDSASISEELRTSVARGFAGEPR